MWSLVLVFFVCGLFQIDSLKEQRAKSAGIKTSFALPVARPGFYVSNELTDYRAKSRIKSERKCQQERNPRSGIAQNIAHSSCVYGRLLLVQYLRPFCVVVFGLWFVHFLTFRWASV